jgi:FkbM family methyltransferase
MSNLKLNRNEVQRWFRDRGDYTHNINYDLTDKSIIMDLGGFTGLWAKQMIDKYNPNIYIIEPIYDFYSEMVNKFSGNDKVHLMNVAIGVEDKEGEIFINGDATSTNIKSGDKVKISYKTMKSLLEYWGLDMVDLIQINIEGDEYPVLESLIEDGLINRFKNIQIQFHYGIDNDIERRNSIRNGLLKNAFKEKFNYPFVWESWTKQ